MERCLHRPLARRTLVGVLVVLVTSSFALQVRDGGVMAPASAQRFEVSHFVTNAFPLAEASVVSAR